ncbi:MAG: hypothetical protein U0103_23795 [Candidatus Obscuribacterales bacterium]
MSLRINLRRKNAPDKSRNIEKLKTEFNLDIAYAGVKEKRCFADILSKHCGIEPNVVSFALLNTENCTVDTGINRNALLWSTLGQLTVQVDDDSICRLMPAPLSQAGLSLDSRFNVYENWFPPEAEISNSTEQCTADADFFAIHEQLLGQSLHRCIEQLGDVELNFDRAGARLLREGAAGHVLATSIGVAGDSGIGSSHYYLSLDGEERARLIETEASYRYYMSNHKLIRSVRRHRKRCGLLQWIESGIGQSKNAAALPSSAAWTGLCLFKLTIFVSTPSDSLWRSWHVTSPTSTIPSRRSSQTNSEGETGGEIIERLVNGLALWNTTRQ